MLRTINSSKEITSYQKKFKQSLLAVCDIQKYVLVGSPGGSDFNWVNYSSKYDFWFLSQKFDDKYWNSFGIGNPTENQSNDIIVEINFYLSGINRRIGGLMLKDNNNVFIAHRGKIGGGREGVGKNLFFTHYNGSSNEIDDGDRLSEVFIIGSPYTKTFPKRISDFVHSVAFIKSKISNKKFLKFTKVIQDYYPEYFGRKKSYKLSSLTYQDSRHGEVVDKLKSLLVNKKYKVGKDRNRDLYVYKSNKITSLFEVKTNVLNQSIYSGIGQLMLYKYKLPKSCKLYLLLPATLNSSIEKTIKSLGIDLIYFNLTENDVKIRIPSGFKF